MRPAVWAPTPAVVELVTPPGRSAMDRDEAGWWRSDEDLPSGTEYGFSLDGSPPLPDPRSRHQPSGVHGMSRVVSLADADDGDWSGFDLPGAVLYEMHVGTFTLEGTFSAAAGRLGHLLDLGVDAVSLMPVNQFPGRHGWGYDGVDLYAVHDAYGGPDGMRQFVASCHRHGLGVVLDVVYNHLGPAGNYLGRFGPYFTDTYRTPWGDAVNLDGRGSDEVRDFFLGNATMWLEEYRVDGLRLDAVHAFFDRSAVHFLEELASRVKALEARLERPLHVIAESDLNDPRLVWAHSRGGYGLDASWSDDFHHSVHAALTGETHGYYADYGSLDQVAKALRQVYVYDGVYSVYRGRRHGRPVDGAAGTRFVGYVQNHDQVGNRARGERLGHLVDSARAHTAAALLLTAPFVPMLFQGEEWSASSPFPYFTDHEEPELAEAVLRGRRQEFASFGWEPESIPDPQDPRTYGSARLDWAEVEQPAHRETFEWYRALIRLRREHPELRDGRLDRVEVTVDREAGTLVMVRGRLVVVANLADRRQRVRAAGTTLEVAGGSVALFVSLRGEAA